MSEMFDPNPQRMTCFPRARHLEENKVLPQLISGGISPVSSFSFSLIFVVTMTQLMIHDDDS